MTRMNPYLNFDGKAEEAFTFYKSVFGGEFLTFNKMSDAPGSDKLPAEERNRVMHVALPISSDCILMASDIICSAGHVLKEGNNVQISLHPENRQEADRLFKGLSAGGTLEMPMQDTFWGAYFGSFRDKYGISWMINCEETKA